MKHGWDCCRFIGNESRDAGARPLISSEIRREYYYLFGLIEPVSGKSLMLELPDLETATMQILMDEFGKQDKERQAFDIDR